MDKLNGTNFDDIAQAVAEHGEWIVALRELRLIRDALVAISCELNDGNIQVSADVKVYGEDGDFAVDFSRILR